MKFLLIIIFSISVLTAFGDQSQTFTKSEIEHLSNSIDKLKNILVQIQSEIDSMKNEINDTKSLIETSNDKITTRINELSDQRNSIEESLKTHFDTSYTFENINNKIRDLQFGVSVFLSAITTLIGIVVGGYISVQHEKRKRKNELTKARTQMQKEFARLRQDALRAILDTRDVLRDQYGGLEIINRLINRQRTVHEEFLSHIHGLHFILWDFTLLHMDQFTENEKDQLKRIHNFINGVNGLLINHHNTLKKRLMRILNSQRTNAMIADAMRDELIIDFKERMRLYSSVHLKIKKLDIPWLHLSIVPENNIDEVKAIAWKSLLLTAFISIGTSIMAVGMSLMFTIIPLLNNMIKSGVFTDQDSKLIIFLNYNALLFLCIGLVIIVISVCGGYHAFLKK
jgi:hypothetical protein